MWSGKTPEYEFEPNPYDSFMRKHLQHYGYYTGRNQGFRQTFASYSEWEKNFAYTVSCSSEEDGSDSESKGGDNKLQEELLKTTQLVYIKEDGKGMVPKLREPRTLYAMTSMMGPQQAARWPSDIQVINKKITHIRYIPPEPEPFYKQTGFEKMPMVRGEERGGRLVYMYEPRSTFFVRSRVGGIRSGPDKAAVELDKTIDDKTLIFEARFESGNLAKAIQVGDYDYELWLRYDLYTKKHTQWYYFAVSNTRPNVTYRFSIVNFIKPDSLYNFGMKPLMYSEKDALQKKIGWHRCGNNIKYYKNNMVYETSRGEKSFYSMTWNVEFPHNHDTVYFAHCFPYTYTDLQDYLLDMSNDPVKSKICKQRVLCRTLAGNLVYVLTITSPSQNADDLKHKKAVVVTSRVHPGESNASWMMKGFLDYLTGSSADAKLLRDTFIFKIVPMLNPDGVVVGNYRCSLAGRDLNRNYKSTLKDSYPSIWHTKQMIRRLLQERDIIVYCDLHGHSRKQNVFLYGCENRHNAERRLRERIFPAMLSRNATDKFHFGSCKFKIQKSKEGTGRIVMWNMGIMNSYTMEATFCGSTLGKNKNCHYSVADYESLGYHFCDTLLDYCDPDTTKSNNLLLELEENLKIEIRDRMAKHGIMAPADVDLADYYSSDIESSDGGSDSSVSDGPPIHLQYTASRVSTAVQVDPPKKKKKLKTKKERDRAHSLKDDQKKQLQNERPSSEQPTSEKKPMSGHQTSHARQEKVIRYTNGSALKRSKSQDEQIDIGHSSGCTAADIADQDHLRRESPVDYYRDRLQDLNLTGIFQPRKSLEPAKCEAEDTQALAVSMLGEINDIKKPSRNEYLEALTTAYLRNGVLYDESGGKFQGKDPPHFRYSGANNKMSPTSFLPSYNLDGLCPHHEQAFAAQLMAHQLQNMTGVKSSRDCLQHGIKGEVKELQPFHEKNKDELLNKILGLPSVVGNSFVRVWKDYLQRQRLHPNPQGNMEELALAQMGQRPGISPIDRRPFPRHLLEVSAAQQRQQEIQMKKDKSTLKPHPIPFDDRDKPVLPVRPLYSARDFTRTRHTLSSHRRASTSKEPFRETIRLPVMSDSPLGLSFYHDDVLHPRASSSRIRTQIPSATFVNYETFKISQMSISPGMEGGELKTDTNIGQLDGANMDLEENSRIVEEEPRRDTSHHSSQGHQKHRSGRVSRREMRDSDEEEEEEEEDGRRAKGPDYVKDPHASRQPRVKSAKGAEETNSAIQSILELKKSLASSALQSNLSPTTGNYINKLLKQETKLKEEVEHTGQEIKKLTTQLQHEIEEKQRQYDSMVDRQNSTSRKGSASDKTVTAKTEVSSTDRNTKSSDPTDGNNNPQTEIDKHNCKKEDDHQTKMVDFKVPPSSASTARSETSIDTAVEYSKKFHSSVLKNDLADSAKPEKHYQTIIKPVNKSNNSTANSLGGDPSSNRVRAKPSGVTNGNSQGPIMLLREQSASSGSSKDDNTERSKTSTGMENKSETFRTESTTRVKSAKNSSSRQIVETVPTKISLMITKDHEDKVNLAGQFLPLSRTVKGPFAKLGKKKQ